MGLLTQGFYSLFSKFNKAKAKGDEQKPEGVAESLGELTLDLEDSELLILKKDWEKLYSNSLTKARIHSDGDVNERYWVGKQFPDSEYENGKRPLSDNIIFEASETMIPLATQQNPEPIVMCDDTPEMKQLGEKIKSALEYLADVNHLKTKLKKGVRYWLLRFLGAWEIGYDAQENEIVVKTVNPKDLILDPNCVIDNGEYQGEFLGHKKMDTAKNLIIRFPDKEQEIIKECENKLGSIMNYTLWVTDEYSFFTLKDIVLAKFKNPNWNYDKETQSNDEYGKPIIKVLPGKNHFNRPRIPYVFLTVFDLGDEPADKTNLVQQGLVTQDNINKRLKQIDRNADNINGGVVVNGLMFNKEQAGQVAEARRQGRTIVTPGAPSDAILFPQMQNLPDVLIETLNDQRVRFLNRFGVSGTTGTNQEETVRGKIIEKNDDSSRIGGGVSEYLEIAASRIFNYFLQMIYVYYDAPHMISVIGPQNTQQVITLKAAELPNDRKMFISVQTGSMVPQDDLSVYNESMSLWEGGALDPLSLFERLKDTNPQERAEKLMMYKMNPAQYMTQYLQVQPPMPTVAQGQPIAQGGGGSESGAPPASVPTPQPQPTAEQVQSNQLIKSVPIPQ